MGRSATKWGHIPQPTQTHFLADLDSTILELYCNPPESVPDYRAMDPLLLHLAFVSADPQADAQRLMAGGATWVSEVHLPNGSHIIMLRDPWGMALQLCMRVTPLLFVCHSV